MAETKRAVVVDPRAELEARSAFLWYLARSPRAADGFQAAFDRALADIVEAPMRWPLFEGGARRRLFAKYPYSLVYDADDERIVVVAVMHQRRRPGYWIPRKP